jgi:glutamate--cysteine ligase
VRAAAPAAVAGLSSRAAAEAYVGGVCFKLGPPRLVGAELEWLTERTDNSRCRVDEATLTRALAAYAPASVNPASPARPLPAGGRVSIEPGGQIEISSAPVESVEQLCRQLDRDAATLRRILADHGVAMIAASADPDRPAERILGSPRYRAMQEFFDHFGPFGRLMMCNTAAVQVCLNAGAHAAELTCRWNALYAVGPALAAAFACSPRLHGVPGGQASSAWASQRLRTWQRLDRVAARGTDTAGTRTQMSTSGGDPRTEYARWALDVPLLCVRRANGAAWTAPAGASFADWMSGALDDRIGRRPELADLDYHLTTVFPPVRAAGHLEVRYLDAQPGRGWATAIRAVAGLMARPTAVADATRIAAGTAGRWEDAARVGLADGELRAAAAQLLELAATQAETTTARADLEAAAARCRAGRCPEAGDRR